MWKAICEVEQRQGAQLHLEQRRILWGSSHWLAADPNMPHESATRHLKHELSSFLSFLGLMGMASIRGWLRRWPWAQEVRAAPALVDEGLDCGAAHAPTRAHSQVDQGLH